MQNSYMNNSHIPSPELKTNKPLYAAIARESAQLQPPYAAIAQESAQLQC